MKNESEHKEVLAPVEDSSSGSAAEPHDYLAVIPRDASNCIVRCPHCERLVGLNNISGKDRNAFTLEIL